MRVAAAICYVLLVCLPTVAQDARRDDDVYSIRLVRESVKNPALARGVSFTEKQLNRLGDRVSVALLKIYDADELKEPANIRRYLPVVRAAFAAPRIVPFAEDRKPKVTMFLLTHLEAGVGDTQLKAQISDTIRYVKEQTSN